MKRLVRTFRHAPGFFGVVVLTLALGIGANTAIFSVVRGILLRPLPYAEQDQLVGIANRWGTNPGRGEVAVLGLLDLQDQAEKLAAVGAYFATDASLAGAGTAERVPVALVTTGLLPLLGVAPSRGRWFTAGEDAPGEDHVVILSHGLWNRRFGADPEIVGKELLLDNERYRVVGVMPPTFSFEADVEMFVPLGFTPEMEMASTRDQHFLQVMGRMKPGVTLEEVNAELEVIGARTRAAHPNIYSADSGWRPHAQPLLDNLVEDVRPSLFLLAAAAGLVLLIVCANVASLLLARASTRHRELSVRAALGATRRRLLLQLLGESLALSALGGLLGVLLALWGTEALLALAPGGLPRADEIRLDGLVLAFSVIVTALTGAIFGLIPAWGASRVDVQEALRASGRTASAGRRPRRVRRALVIGETALALILVTSAALVTRSFARVIDVDPGFRPEGVLSLGISLPTSSDASADDPTRRAVWFAEAAERLASLPGVTSVGATHRLPFRDGGGNRILDLEGAPTPAGEQRPSAQFRHVTPGYLETMGIPLRSGRTIGREDTTGGLPAAVVSESFARQHWPGREPLGRKLRTSSPQGPWLTVVGVVGDVRHRSLEQPALPTVYAAAAQEPGLSALSFVLRATVPMDHLAGAVRAELARFDPRQPVHDVMPMTERLARSVQQRRFVLVLFELFAVLALGLAALGLYGVLAHAVTERQREIGVRVALGATRANVLGLVAREGGVLVGVGVALGVAGGLAGTRLLAHLLYDVSPSDPLALIAAIVLLGIAAAVAVWIPARRALRVDPMVALRDE
jgi:putative ABC transport system permease protein